MEMKYPVKKEEEDQKGVFIDLDTRGNSPEDFVIEWHLEIRRFFGSNSVAVGESNLVKVMKRYIRDVSQRAVHFEDIERLQTMVDKHMEHIYWLYQDSDICFSDLYLFYMEQIMTFYVNLTLRVLLALKRKTKVTQKMVHDMTQKVVKRLSSYLLKSEYHIFHVLIRQTTTLVDEMIKDVLNILNSNICKQMFKNLYMHFLVQTPVADMSDEAFCRVYILFENWKAFDDYKQNEKFEECMRKLFNRGVDYVKSNAFLKKILQPHPSIMNELMKVVGCDPSITKAYFDYIKSKQKAEAEILDDIGRLALEDAYISDSDSEEDESDAQYKEFFNQIMCDSNIDNGELKSDKGFLSEIGMISKNDEIIICDSDTDSDVEFVAIIPSRSNVNTPSPSSTPLRKKNPPNERPKVTSFLESISVDIELYRGNQGSRTKKSNSQPKIQEGIESSQVQNADALFPLQTSQTADPNLISDSSVRMECVDVDGVEVIESSNLTSENSRAEEVVDLNNTIISGDNNMSGPSEQSSIVCEKSCESSGLSQLENSKDVTISKNPEITDGPDRTTVNFESESNTTEDVCQRIEIAEKNEKIPSTTKSTTIEATEENVQLNETTNEVSVEGCLKSPQNSTPHSSDIVEEINNEGHREENLQTSNRTDTNSLTNDSKSDVYRDKTRTITGAQSFQNKDKIIDFAQEKLLATNLKTSENLCETNLIKSSRVLVDNKNCPPNLEIQLQSSNNSELATINVTKLIDPHQKIITTVNNELRKLTEEVVEQVDSITSNDLEKSNIMQDNLFEKELSTVRDLTSQLGKNLNLEGNTLNHLEDTLADMNLTSDYQLENSLNIQSNDKQLEILVSEDKISNNDDKCSRSISSFKTTEISSNCEQLESENLKSCKKCGRYSKIINIYPNKDLSSTKSEKNYEKRMNSKNTCQLNKASESLIIDTGQSNFSKLLDTGQVEISNSKSSYNTNTQSAEILEVHNDEEQLTARTNSEQKVRENVRAGHCEFGYPTPPGSEEDGDKDVDEQPDPIYTTILISGNSAFNEDRFAPETNSTSDAPQVSFTITVSESTLTTLSASTLSQTYPVIFRGDESIDRLSVVPQTVSELVNSERTSVNDDYLSEDVDVSDEEKEESNYINPVLGKTYALMVKDAVSTEDEGELEGSIVPQKGNVHSYGETPPQTPQSRTNCPVAESVDSLVDMEQFLKKYGGEESSLPRSSKRRKRSKENLNNEIDGKVSKNLTPKSTKRVKINNKPETQVISPSPPTNDGGDDTFNNSNASNTNDDEYVSSADEKTTNSDSVQMGETRRKHKSTAEPKPSPVPLSEYRTKKNGMNTRIPQSGTSSLKQPPLKGILKRVEQKHSYYPLHPLEDESDTVVIVLQQSEGRGKRGSIEVKINRKSFTAYKVPFNDPKLCQRIIVNVERLSANTLLVWERVTSRSRGNFVEDMPIFQPDKPMYKIVFDKNTTQLSSNDRKYYCEPSISDESSALYKLKNSNLVPGNDTGTVYSTTEIAFNESHKAAIPAVPPCFSPSSNSSSEFSDPINLIPYQDIERALQVVEPDDKLTESLEKPSEILDTLQTDSNDILDRSLVDNISAETIHLLSNNADFHKMFCDLDGIENVPVLDTEETEDILNNSAIYIKPSKLDVCLSNKLSDDLLSNLNSDEQLLKEVCRELESKALVDSFDATYSDSIGINKNNSEVPQTEIVSEDLDNIPKHNPVSISLAQFSKHSSSELVQNFTTPVSLFVAPNYPNSFNPEIRKRLPKELLSINSQLNDLTVDETKRDWQKNKGELEVPTSSSQEFLPAIPQLEAGIPQGSYLDKSIFQNTQINSESIQKSPIYRNPQLNQSFQNSRVGQPLICSRTNDISYPETSKPSLIVNLCIPPESLKELSLRKRSFLQRDFYQAQNATENVPPVQFEPEPVTNSTVLNPLNHFQKIPEVVKTLQQNVTVQLPQFPQTPKTDPPEANVAPSNTRRLRSQTKQTSVGRKRGRPPKNTKNNKTVQSQSILPESSEQVSNDYNDRVPSVYHPKLQTIQRFSDDPRLAINKTTHVVTETKTSPKFADHTVTSAISCSTVTPLPMPVPHTFNFETDTLKKEVYNSKLEFKTDNSENEIEFETHLPLKKRKLSIPLPLSVSSISVPVPMSGTTPLSASISNASILINRDTIASQEISYPATPMLSIADVVNHPQRTFKTPAEKKQLPPSSPPIPICFGPTPNPTHFSCSMNTFTSALYKCPYNGNIDCSSCCPPPPVIFPPNSFSHSN